MPIMAEPMAGLEDIIRAAWPPVKRRVQELEQRHQQMMSDLKLLESELGEAKREYDLIVDTAKKVGFDPDAPKVNKNGEPFLTDSYPVGSVTIKQAARLTLDAFTSGLDSADLLAALSGRYFEGQLERTSFSPQLSRMSQAGEVEQRNSVWVLTDKGRAIMAKQPMLPYRVDPKTNETADAGASEVSDAAPAKS
ncbi:hypothetical protein MKK58_16465 [Methylobacterium sp. J-078]|uniref:hypothetical protein n=1 Tax=Methylobacterium sp. J-078 TaxID=2836657 RepID=UPI001FBB01CC|nr:hypothetical protein [Methylobacterium sp. J-078]MCJ2046109.1 hypothetical protein [Methylobacterium sp. J-078]